MHPTPSFQQAHAQATEQLPCGSREAPQCSPKGRFSQGFQAEAGIVFTSPLHCMLPGTTK